MLIKLYFNHFDIKSIKLAYRRPFWMSASHVTIFDWLSKNYLQIPNRFINFHDSPTGVEVKFLPGNESKHMEQLKTKVQIFYTCT